jgi:hypothetical protein
MFFAEKLLKEFWKLKKKTNEGLDNEIELYKNGKGWFKKNEQSLFKFLSRRTVKLEARISKTEIEKMVKRNLPYTELRRWEGNELIVDIDIMKLKRDVIREAQVYSFKQIITMIPSNYVICPVIKEESQKYFLLIQ